MTATEEEPTAPPGEMPSAVVLADTSRRRGRGGRKGRSGHQHSAKSKGRSRSGGGSGGDGGPGDGMASVRRRHRRLPWILALVAILLVGGGTWVAVSRVNSPLAIPVAHADAVVRTVVPGASPVLPWPGKGQGAVSIPELKFAAQSGPESPVPVASLTKLTTAVVILRDHPIPAGTQGPTITVTADDVTEYQAELHLDQSTVTIQAGETLTERQMLEALLIQSANDIAYSLAVWDAGSVPAFVAKMNALAAALGATHSTFVDASGYDSRSVSSAGDVLLTAAAGMAIPTFAEIVALPSVTFPLAGTLHNVVSEVGANGVVGIKSGYTWDAGACLVLAANRTVQGRQVLVMVAELGQPTPPPTVPTTTTSTTTTAPATAPSTGATTTTAPRTPSTTTTTSVKDLPIADPFKYARPTTEALMAATQAAITTVTVAAPHQAVGSVAVSWGGVTHAVPYAASTGAWLPGWPGQVVDVATRFRSVAPGSKAGTRVGTTLYAVGSAFVAVPLVLVHTVPEPSVWWRLAHS
jgi:serine-type D-Ala-D-Ala carboxypeptidase (penicillin-binding protein 5/6)